MTDRIENPSPASASAPLVLAGIVLLAAAAIRLAGINCPLWLDEIWSIRLAQTAASAWDVFFLHHDNNHWLNTLYVYFLGPGRPWWTYHVLAEITGIGTVLLGYLLSRRNAVVLVLLATSEFLVEFSSDARGYAPAGFFALLCLWMLDRHLARPRRMTAAGMNVAAVLGLLSHLTFVVILAGLIVSSIIALRRRKRSWPAALAQTALWWAVPAAVIASLYLADVRYLVRGGGPDTPADLASQTAAMTLGLAVGSRAAGVCGIAVLILCAVQCRRLIRGADPAWPLYLIALLFVPGLVLLWPRTDYIHPRYVYVAVPLLAILAGMELSRWLSGPRWARVTAVVVLIGYVGMNGARWTHFLRYGRGDYRGALRYMIDQTKGTNVVVGSDRHPDSTMMVLQYYDRFEINSPSRFLTLNSENWGDQWPQWMVAEEDLGARAATSAGVQYIRRANFPKGAVTSGISWTIYEAASGQPFVRERNLRDLSR